MRRKALLITAGLALALSACTGTPKIVLNPPAPGSLAPLFVSAVAKEAQKSTDAEEYLGAIDSAVQGPGTPEALATTIASLDALVFGATPDLEVAGHTAVAYRSAAALATIVTRLEKAWTTAGAAIEAQKPSPRAPLVRALIARALHRLAMYSGNEQAAATWMARRGCALQASVFGPIDWSALTGIEGPSPVSATGPLPEKLPGIAPFAADLTPVLSEADSCSLDNKGANYMQGSRVLVIDVESPSPQRASLVFSSSSAATVDVGGVTVIRRRFDAGGDTTIRFGAVDLPEGWTRVVVRVARRGDGDDVELDLFGQNGERLNARAPRPGEVAPGIGKNPEAIEIAPTSGSDASVVLAGAALLGLGETRAAEHLLEPLPIKKDETPKERSAAMELVYTRALLTAGDVPFTKAAISLRAATDRILKEWKGSWEAKLLKARLAERRKGWGDGAVDALTELGVLVAAPGDPAKVPGASDTDPMILASIAQIAKRSRLSDVAESAYSELATAATGSPLVTNADHRLHGRTGAEKVKAACDSGIDRASTYCFSALSEQGEGEKALTEIERIRRLRAAPTALREQEIHERIRMGDKKGALAVYESMPACDRGMLDVLGFVGVGDKALPGTNERYMRDRLTARDVPWALSPLGRLLGITTDPAPALENEGKEIIKADKASTFLPGAGTAVLKHSETYELDENGLLHYVVYDLRRVSGTTDVAYGAHSYGPIVEGRGASRRLRRRIHKPDGRILEPDAAAFAFQGGSDLSQLETGDYVEQISEGYSLPNDMGQLTIDTPDLLPERTSVKNATISFTYPQKLGASMWSHPLLGKPAETTTGGKTKRVYTLRDANARRIEDGIPPLERSVAVSFGTQTWANIGRALEEQIRALGDHDPFVTRWIAEAAGEDKTPSRALVERIVAAAGKKIKMASGGELSDIAATYSDGAQRSTTRGNLLMGLGSRTWLVYRALTELGVSCDIAISETEPYTTAETFPVHAGRFRHPLVVAHLGGSEGDVWIDADVDGPPLPPGRISPELRGRTAMLPGGKLVKVEGTATETVDEIDVRLALDDKGDAKGSFTILLHGRPAQILADAFEVVVGTERQSILRGVVLGWLPWADVDEVALSSSPGSWEIALRASIRINGFGRPEGKDAKVWVLPGLEPVHLLGGRNVVSTLGATYASRAERQSALSIDSPMQYHVRRRIELPKGAAVTREPAIIDVRDAHLTANRKGSYKDNVIEEDFHLSLPTGTIDADRYQQFVARVHIVDDGFMAGIRVKK